MLGLIGMTDTQFIYAEGLDIKSEGYLAEIVQANKQLEQYINTGI